MKTNLLFLFTTICLICSCSNEEIIEISKTDNPLKQGQTEEKRYLNINADIEHRTETRSSVEIWAEGMQMNVFSPTQSTMYSILNGQWTSENPIEIDKNNAETKITAVFPYNQNNTNSKVDINMSEQKDIMYANSVLTGENTSLKLKMRHALTLLKFKINKGTYNQGNGQVNSIKISNILKSAFLDPSTGVLQKNGELTEYTLGGNFYLSDNMTNEAIVIPNDNAIGVTITLNLDGKDYKYEIPSNTTWQSGVMYTYTLNLKDGTNMQVYPDDYTVNVDYWTDYGKHDNLVFRDYGNDEIEIAPNYSEYGYDHYTGEGNIFGVCMYYYNWVEDVEFKGYCKFLLMNGNKIVEQYPEFPFSCGNGRFICKTNNCFVTANPGTYQLVPIFRKDGESKWFKSSGYDNNTGNNAKEWEYEIKAKTDMPALRMINIEGEKFLYFSIFSVPDNEYFNVEYIISNKSLKALRGKIKLTWEREFKMKSNSYRPSNKKQNWSNDDEFCDIIGTQDINIPANAKFWKNTVACKIPIKRNAAVNNDTGAKIYFSPIVHVYFMAEGTDEWKLLRVDCDWIYNPDKKDNGFSDATNWVRIKPNSWN